MDVGWHPDPTGRHQQRYFNGVTWTGDVADDGTRSVDVTTSPVWGTTVVATSPAAERSSALATAGMILGIVGVVTGVLMVVFYVAVVCGALALVFGLVAARRCRRAGLTVDGRARTAIVLGPIALALSVIGAIVFVTVVQDVIDHLERVAPASSFELGEATCVVVDGSARFETRLTNTTDDTDRFTVVAEFLDPASGRVVASGRSVVEDVRPADPVPIVVTAPVELTDVDCRVDVVRIGTPLFES
ncbi:MAG: DUF2510 domain-containing protein [Acidimicrobiia bacterium]